MNGKIVSMRTLLLLCVVPFLLGAQARPTPPKQEIVRFRLELQVPSKAGIFFSSWADGDVITDHDGSDGKVVTYRMHLIWHDTCEWVATEKLTPLAADKYKYEYRETPVSCPPGATADTGAVTPRDGIVQVFPLKEDKPLTPLTSWAKGWERRK
jgi:hypothetical protein